MIKLSIDNIEINVKEGTSLIEAARANGIEVPSLCYHSGLPHYSSCMVCMVKDNTTGKFIPSCSAKAENGQDIDASGTEVHKLRQEALSLLLSEHRAECEAPCKNVCPAGYNIPLINRYLMNKDMESAWQIIKNNIISNGFACENCKAPCEKACRRKSIDLTISIKNLVTFIYNNYQSESGTKEFAGVGKLKKFNSTIGRIEESERSEWLKESIFGKERFRNPGTIEEVFSEASSCMHCDCRALDNCRLRDLCDALEVKNPRRMQGGHPIHKKINENTGLIFENAKCIKCGLCVRFLENKTNDSSLCFTGRGYMSIISQPMTHSFNEILNENIDELVNICPTGALSKREPGAWGKELREDKSKKIKVKRK